MDGGGAGPPISFPTKAHLQQRLNAALEMSFVLPAYITASVLHLIKVCTIGVQKLHLYTIILS